MQIEIIRTNIFIRYTQHNFKYTYSVEIIPVCKGDLPLASVTEHTEFTVLDNELDHTKKRGKFILADAFHSITDIARSWHHSREEATPEPMEEERGTQLEVELCSGIKLYKAPEVIMAAAPYYQRLSSGSKVE